MARWHGLQKSTRTVHCCVTASWYSNTKLAWAKTRSHAFNTDGICTLGRQATKRQAYGDGPYAPRLLLKADKSAAEESGATSLGQWPARSMLTKPVNAVSVIIIIIIIIIIRSGVYCCIVFVALCGNQVSGRKTGTKIFLEDSWAFRSMTANRLIDSVDHRVNQLS